MSLRSHTTHLRIDRIKALMLHHQAFPPTNKRSACSFTFPVRMKYGSSVHNIRRGHLLFSPYLMRENFLKVDKLLVVSRFQHLNVKAIVQRLENCGFRYIQIAGNLFSV